jgi:hypothetical protein
MSATAECPKCRHSLPLHFSGICPNCGLNVKLVNDGDSGQMKESVSLEATTYELTDKEFDSILRDELKRYLREKLGAMKITKVDRDIKAVKLKVSKFITEPEFASAAAAYVSLRSQEQQANSNLMLQWLIAFLAAGTFVAGILSYLHPH